MLRLILFVVFAGWLISTSAHAVESADKKYDAAETAFREGKLDLAITLFGEVIKANPKNAMSYNNRAVAYRQNKNYIAALADLNQAIQRESSWVFWYNRGVTFAESGDQPSAIADFTRALKAHPPGNRIRTDCLIARAHCYFDQEKTAPAMTDLNAAIKLGVKEPDAYVLRGILHKIAHGYPQSLADYEKAIALDPENARSYDVAAYLLSAGPSPKYRDGAKAVRYATKACELTHWQSSQEIETLAAAYAESGKFDDAIKFTKQADALDPKATDSKRLALYEQRQPFRDLNRKETAVPLPPTGTVAIKLGEKVQVHLKVDVEQLVDPAAAKITDRPELDSFLLNFHLEKGRRVLLLEHSFGKVVRMKCLARLKDQDVYFETDLLPIQPGTISKEIWDDPIEELVFFDFHFSDDSRSNRLLRCRKTRHSLRARHHSCALTFTDQRPASLRSKYA
ncbi:MAG: tetratricopeptide repeat protein [Chthoniobacterales bacterium]